MTKKEREQRNRLHNIRLRQGNINTKRIQDVGPIDVDPRFFLKHVSDALIMLNTLDRTNYDRIMHDFTDWLEKDHLMKPDQAQKTKIQHIESDIYVKAFHPTHKDEHGNNVHYPGDRHSIVYNLVNNRDGLDAFATSANMSHMLDMLQTVIMRMAISSNSMTSNIKFLNNLRAGNLIISRKDYARLVKNAKNDESKSVTKKRKK